VSVSPRFKDKLIFQRRLLTRILTLAHRLVREDSPSALQAVETAVELLREEHAEAVAALEWDRLPSVDWVAVGTQIVEWVMVANR
jgi:hypothetical protein